MAASIRELNDIEGWLSAWDTYEEHLEKIKVNVILLQYIIMDAIPFARKKCQCCVCRYIYQHRCSYLINKDLRRNQMYFLFSLYCITRNLHISVFA